MTISGENAFSNLVYGNFIGTEVTGTAALGNNLSGINIASPGNIIGGTTAEARNVISGNIEHGVSLTGAISKLNIVQGNFIGTEVTGTAALGNGMSGVYISVFASGNTIGQRNVISGNREGVLVALSNGNWIVANSIFANGGLGIKLEAGGNLRQNPPKFTSADPAGTLVGGTFIRGTLNDKPQTAFRLEFFLNTACDPSGNGEGEMWLGFTDITTEPDGTASFSVRLDIPVPEGKVITATATDPDNNTSEFSECYFIPL